MKRIKRLMAIMLLALVTSLAAPQAFAGTGEMPGLDGTGEMPGVAMASMEGTAESSGIMEAILDYLASIF